MNDNPLDPTVLLVGLIVALLNALAAGFLPYFNDFFNLDVAPVSISEAAFL